MKRKKLVSRLFAGLLAVVMAFCMPYPSYSTGGVVHAASGVEAKINELRNKYPNGQYWHKVNGVNAVTTIPCSHKDGSVYNLNSDSTNGCGKTYLGWQCVGFASQIFYEIFGENITDYKGTRTDKENIMIGDYVRINNTHSFIVTARYGNTLKCVECNWSGPCRIGWDQEHSISQVTGFYHASNYDEINNINVSPELQPDPSNRPLSDGDYFIVSAVEGSILQPWSKGLTFQGIPNSTARAVLGDVLNNKDSLFKVEWIGDGFYSIKLKASSDLSLDTFVPPGEADQVISLYNYHGGTNQQWFIKSSVGGSYTVQSRKNGRYMDNVNWGKENGNPIRMGNGNGATAQNWYFIPYYEAPSEDVLSGEYQIFSYLDQERVLSARGNGTAPRTSIELNSNRNDYRHTFTVIPKGNGCYEIVNKNSNLALEAPLDSMFTRLGTRSDAGAYNQRWIIRPCANNPGYFNILSKWSGNYLDVYGAVAYDGVDIAAHFSGNINGGQNQQWKFVPYVSPESVSLNENNLTLCVGKSATFRAVIAPDRVNDQTLNWKYGNSGIITAAESDQGNELTVTANTVGEAEISVETCNLKKATCKVTVREHSYGAEWKTDEEKHWKECACGEKSEEGAHSFTWKIDQAATEETEGVKHEECTVCGLKRNENTAIEKLPSGMSVQPITPVTPDNPTSGAERPRTENGELRLDVQGSGNAPTTRISTSESDLAKILLTEGERRQMAQGTDIRIILEVKDAASTVSDADKALAEKAAAGFSIGQYLDISLFKMIGEKQNVVTETIEKISITIDVPENLKNTDKQTIRTFMVIHVHGGSTETLSDIDDDASTITIETDRFSTYAIAYKDTLEEEKTDNGADISTEDKVQSPKTGDNMLMELYVAFTVISGTVLLLLHFVWKKKRLGE